MCVHKYTQNTHIYYANKNYLLILDVINRLTALLSIVQLY